MSREDLRTDARYFFATLDSVHIEPYGRITRGEIDTMVERVLALLPDSLDQRVAFLALQPIVSRLGDAHSRVIYPTAPYQAATRAQARLFPLDLVIERDQAFVSANFSDDASLAPGTEVHAVDGMPVAALIDSLRRLVSAERKAFGELLVQWSFRALYWAAFGSADSVLITTAGSPRARPVSMITAGELRARRDTATPPPTLEYEVLEPERIGVVTIRSMISDGEAFRDFLVRTFAAVRHDSVRALVVDLRENAGGNAQRAMELLPYVTTRPFTIASRIETRSSAQLRRRIRAGLPKGLRWVPDGAFALHPRGRAILRARMGDVVTHRPPTIQPGPLSLRYHGPVYVLIGRGTFSAATTLAAMVADHGLATLVGEETGGLGTAFTDIHRFTLPRTGLLADVALRRHVRPNGIDDGRGVLPDIEIPTSAEAVALGRDPVMAAVRRLVGSPPESTRRRRS